MKRDAFFDTNILVYAHTHQDAKGQTARSILTEGAMVGVQALNEFASVMHGKFGFAWPMIEELIANLLIVCPNPLPLSLESHQKALSLSSRYGFSIWDSLMIAAALEAGCTRFLTEDLQHGQVIEGLRIENPFLAG